MWGVMPQLLLRNNLETFKKRLKRLEEHVAKTGAVLTEAQLPALETKKDQDIVHGEIETELVTWGHRILSMSVPLKG